MNFSLRFFGRVFVFRSALMKSPKLGVTGITSRCFDGSHVLFLDYDGVSREVVDLDLRRLSDYCSHFFVFRTFEEKDDLGVYGNYHVICADKFSYGGVHDLLKLAHVDRKHRNMVNNTRYRAWVLRSSGKGSRSRPEFVEFVTGKVGFHECFQSSAHVQYIKNLYPETNEFINGLNWNNDSSNELTMTTYLTNKEKPI